jgi:hypothetical protein
MAKKVVTTVRWKPAQKQRRPSALDLLNETVHLPPRFETFASSLADTPNEDSLVDVVNSHWAAAQRSMLMIGRYLLRAQNQFRGSFMRAIVPHLHFEYRTANMLMQIALRVQEGVVPQERLPTSYRAAYRLVTLSTSDLALADKRGLLRPDTRQRDGIASVPPVRRASAKVVQARIDRSCSDNRDQLSRTRVRRTRQNLSFAIKNLYAK